jgi:hypothetical protein
MNTHNTEEYTVWIFTATHTREGRLSQVSMSIVPTRWNGALTHTPSHPRRSSLNHDELTSAYLIKHYAMKAYGGVDI